MLDPKCPGLRGRRAKRDSEQVKRNVGRFPDDFAFVLTKEESESLRSQIATLKKVGASTENTSPACSPSTARSWPPRS